MGNTNKITRDPEIRALVHEVDSHLHSKSALLYQISQLKLKINSKKNYADGTDESSAIEDAKKDIIISLEKIRELESKETVDTPTFKSIEIEDFSAEIEEKSNLITEIDNIREQKLAVIQELQEIKTSIEQTFSERYQKFNGPYDPTKELDLKLVYQEILQENEKLSKISEELQNKTKFLERKKMECLSRKGNRRKTVLGLSIVNSEAAQLRTKYILKNEIIRTIQTTTSEQQIRRENIERNKLEMFGVDKKEEESNLLQEINKYKDQILELEWEIQGLVQERDKYRKSKFNSSELSMNLGIGEKMPSEMSENSFGDSIASLVNGMEEHRIDKDALLEENIRLNQHIAKIFSVKGQKFNLNK